MAERKQILLRLDPAVHDALARWAADELRSTTAQIEFLLRQSLGRAGRMPQGVGGLPRRGRPRKEPDKVADTDTDTDPAAAAAADSDSAASRPQPQPQGEDEHEG
ncbi:hypothetical protein [Actinocrinis puniceicyclus]|uniref:hypothetical protein n=1 Tax=Actinocrinis puniceicyclus TaxID=977794 RepID=UPI0028A9F807|nr:hypothetical protein [Actinocrinis puniceicyclus]